MADIEFAVGEFGDAYDITIYNSDGSLMDVSGFNSWTMTIKSTDRSTTILTKSLTNPSESVVRWTMLSTDTATISPGTYIAQITMVDSGISIRRKTVHMSVKVIPKLD